MGLKKNKFYGRENDYGQKYHFYLKNLDGSAYDLTALTITL